MSRYETRYDEKIMKHYFYDTELKEMVKFDDIRNYLDQQDRQIKELKNINKKLNLENQKLYEDLYCEPNNRRLAIEELEKVKYSILDACNGYWRYYYKNGSAYMKEDDIINCCEEYITNRIKELKE